MPRILIVEDDDHIRTALKLMFEGEGFDVDDAPTGELGIALFSRMTSDVAIVDIMLPGMTGFQTCEAIRSSSDVPIVIVSARDETADVVLGLESGADDYVTKPFVPARWRCGRRWWSSTRCAPPNRARPASRTGPRSWESASTSALAASATWVPPGASTIEFWATG